MSAQSASTECVSSADTRLPRISVHPVLPVRVQRAGLLDGLAVPSGAVQRIGFNPGHACCRGVPGGSGSARSRPRLQDPTVQSYLKEARWEADATMKLLRNQKLGVWRSHEERPTNVNTDLFPKDEFYLNRRKIYDCVAVAVALITTRSQQPRCARPPRPSSPESTAGSGSPL
jgi:hypothetical protein